MTAAHTPGRIWFNSEKSAIVHGDDGRIACPPNHSQRWAWDENARRLVACWNAFDGMPTNLIETMPARVHEIVLNDGQVAEKLTRQCADLLQELRNIANADTAEWDDRSEFEAWAKSRARAAIAKVQP